MQGMDIGTYNHEGDRYKDLNGSTYTEDATGNLVADNSLSEVSCTAKWIGIAKPPGLYEAAYALTFSGRDMRSYGAQPPHVDCSMFMQETALYAGYKLPRTAYAQAQWFKIHGYFSNDLSQAQVGDHIFWDRGGLNYHTGIITNVDGGIKVTHSTVFNHFPGSIMTNTVNGNGLIQGWHFQFVGIGGFR
jgi:hypothetical protein